MEKVEKLFGEYLSMDSIDGKHTYTKIGETEEPDKDVEASSFNYDRRSIHTQISQMEMNEIKHNALIDPDNMYDGLNFNRSIISYVT